MPSCKLHWGSLALWSLRGSNSQRARLAPLRACAQRRGRGKAALARGIERKIRFAGPQFKDICGPATDFLEWISLARCVAQSRGRNGISQTLLRNQFEISGELAAKIIVSLLYMEVTRFFCVFWFENSEKIFDFFLKNLLKKTTARFVFLKGFLVSGQNLRNCGSRGPRQLAASFREELCSLARFFATGGCCFFCPGTPFVCGVLGS